MDLRTFLVSALVAITTAQQYHDNGQYNHQPTHPPSVILNHKQALNQDGSFQYSFAADNGLKQGESISPDGSRRGAYSYVDPNGKTITVTYTADKNGFHVQGDHLPKPVQPLTPHAAQPQPQYQAPPHQQQQGFAYQGPSGQGYNGPATFPSAPARQQQYYPKPAYSQSQPQYRAYDDEVDYDDGSSVDPNKPHSFGDGYSFQFAG